MAQTTAWGAPVFGDSRSYPVGTSPVGIVAGEFSGADGLDLATADEGNTVTILANRGDGVFDRGGRVPVNADRFTVTGIISGEFNGDAIADFALSADDSQNFPDFAGAAVIYRSTRTVYRYGAVDVSIGVFPSCITLADATGDGRPDLVACGSAVDGSGVLSVVARNADNTLANTSTTIPLGTIAPTGVVGADLDKDGRADLLVLDATANSVWILYGRSSGAPFDAPVALSAVDAPSAAVIAQFDDGNLPGIAITSRLAGKVQVFRQTSARTFSAPVAYPVGIFPVDIVAADFDNNQTQDLVAANNGSNDATLLLGNGDGTFRTGETVRVGLGPVAVVTGDFDGNGKPDFATANQNDETFGTDTQSVSVVLNGVSPPLTPTPSLTPSRTPRRTETPTPAPTFNCTGDCNNDGSVTVDEILTMVNIALGNADVGSCSPGDANNDQQITVDEILTAVNIALNGCPVVTKQIHVNR